MINPHPVTGKTVFITGASRGIGAAAAREFAGHGAKTVLAARSTDDLDRITYEITSLEGEALAVSCDVSDPNSVENALERARQSFGSIDIIVNNAGVIEPISRLAESDPNAWAQVININLLGAYYCTRLALPDMQQTGGGTVINISSGAANNALEGWSHYSTSKAALKMFTQTIHKELVSEGVRAIGLSPGTVATEMQVQIKASGINPVSQLDPAVHIPADWVGKAIAWLCTSEADAHLGTDVSLRDENIRKAVGLLSA